MTFVIHFYDSHIPLGFWTLEHKLVYASCVHEQKWYYILSFSLRLIAIVGDITPSDGVPKEEKSRMEQAALNEMCDILGGGMRGIFI